ncbi:MAG: hypothetical protein R3C59_09645 [Planctomycetaceae bacterium]
MIAFEAAVAAYILIAPAWCSWISVIVTFVLFAVAALYSLMIGTDCHCFGDSFSAKLMLPLDLAVLLISHRFRPFVGSRSRAAINWTILLPLTAAFGFVTFANYHREHQMAGNVQDLDMLLADMWVGKKWPLNQSHHPKLRELENGKWLVLVVRSDCEHCRELIGVEFSDPQRHRLGERTAVFIAGAPIWPFQLDDI